MKRFVLGLILLCFTIPAIAETYSWEDENGTVNFSEDLSRIPKKYRKKARIIGYEEAAPAAQSKGEQEQPALQQSSNSIQREKRATDVKVDKNATYGGKDAKAWKAEFGAANADLKAVEKQLVDYRNRMKDTGSMSRSEYLSLDRSVKMIESSVQDQRKKLGDMKQEAEKAGVPAELMEN